MTRRKLLHPCRECKRGRALWPLLVVCQRCFERSVRRAMAPLVAHAMAVCEALERAAKGAGR